MHRREPVHAGESTGRSVECRPGPGRRARRRRPCSLCRSCRGATVFGASAAGPAASGQQGVGLPEISDLFGTHPSALDEQNLINEADGVQEPAGTLSQCAGLRAGHLAARRGRPFHDEPTAVRPRSGRPRREARRPRRQSRVTRQHVGGWTTATRLRQPPAPRPLRHHRGAAGRRALPKRAGTESRGSQRSGSSGVLTMRSYRALTTQRGLG